MILIKPCRALLAATASVTPLVGVAAASQQFQLEGRTELTTVNGAASNPELADVSGDGILDALFLSTVRPGLSVSRGIGNGDFEIPVSSAQEIGVVRQFYLGDMEGDGDLDIVAAVTGQLYLMTNDGAGAISSSGLGIDPTSFAGVELADVTSDGFLDIVVEKMTSPGTRSIEYYPALGGGLFGPPIQVAVGGTRLRVADVDGDGNVDLLLSFGSVVRVVPGLGGGAFGAPVQLLTVTGQAIALLDNASDVDGDGAVDLFGALGQQRAFFRGLGGGAFADAEIFGPMPLAPSPDSILLDLDADGDKDALLFEGSLFQPTNAIAFIQTPAGTFQSGVSTGLGYAQYAAGDLDGDGIEDLLRVSFSGDLSWFLGSGSASTGYFGGERAFAPRHLDNLSGLAIADLDDDADDDVIVFDNDEGRVGWIENEAPDVTARLAVLFDTTLNIATVEAVDFEGDGDIDLIVFGDNIPQLPVSRTFSVWLNDGSPGSTLSYTQGPEGSVPFQNGNAEMIARDFDGDGDVDVLLTAPESGQIGVVPKLFINRGFGLPFQVTSPFGLGVMAREVDAGDFNGDGLVDLAFSRLMTSGLYELTVLPGFGLGAFQPPVALSGLLDGYRVEVVDFEGDGADDILLADPVLGLSYWRNSGGFAFEAPAQLVALPLSFSFQSIDFDSDGDQDLAFTSSIGAVLALQENSATIGDAFPLSVEPLSLPLLLADLDGDGDGEAIVIDADFDAVIAYENTGLQAIGSGFCGPFAAALTAIGSDFVADNDITLRAQNVPPAQFGIAVGSRAFGPPLPFPGGILCLTGAIGRYDDASQIMQSSPAGVMALELNLGALSLPTGTVPGVVGETWCFQIWHRTPSAQMSAFTTGVSVQLR